MLYILLGINAAMFVLELGVGWVANSSGLIADSLDMFADAAVYGSSLYAVRRGAAAQMGAARLSGWLQLSLAGLALVDVVRRALFGYDAAGPSMIVMASVALLANVTCLALLFRHRDGGVHMKASWIFSATDVIANLGVIVAGVAVAVLGSSWPDSIVGLAIVLVVLRAGLRILRLSAAKAPGDAN